MRPSHITFTAAWLLAAALVLWAAPCRAQEEPGADPALSGAEAAQVGQPADAEIIDTPALAPGHVPDDAFGEGDDRQAELPSGEEPAQVRPQAPAPEEPVPLERGREDY
jgi:hypothetical protein